MIYTSYFAKVKDLDSTIVPIAICGKAPDWWDGLQYKKLAPKWSFFKVWKETHDNCYYIENFNKLVLNELDPNEVVAELKNLANSDDICLLCYEKPEDFCHRHLVAEWLNNNGIPCVEWPESYREIYADLFSVDNSYALVHCISSDFALGAGIAKEFAKRGVKDILIKNNERKWDNKGYCLVVATKNHIVANLVTKENCYDKPTYDSLKESLIELRDWAIDHKVYKLAMPQIGCGLDRLEWPKVSAIIKEVFEDSGIAILVCIKNTTSKYEPLVLDFIKRRFPIDCNWTSGNCYYFAFILKARFPKGTIYYDITVGHFVLKIEDNFYDYNGVYKPSKSIIPWDEMDEYDSNVKKAIIRDVIK